MSAARRREKLGSKESDTAQVRLIASAALRSWKPASKSWRRICQVGTASHGRAQNRL